MDEVSPEELVRRDKIRKEKAIANQKKYRERIKAGKNYNVSPSDYKETQAEYMRKYRAEKKIKMIEAYAKANPETETVAKTEKKKEEVKKKTNLAEARRSNRDSKQVDLSIKQAKTIEKPVVKKQIIPLC